MVQSFVCDLSSSLCAQNWGSHFGWFLARIFHLVSGASREFDDVICAVDLWAPHIPFGTLSLCFPQVALSLFPQRFLDVFWFMWFGSLFYSGLRRFYSDHDMNCESYWIQFYILLQAVFVVNVAPLTTVELNVQKCTAATTVILRECDDPRIFHDSNEGTSVQSRVRVRTLKIRNFHNMIIMKPWWCSQSCEDGFRIVSQSCCANTVWSWKESCWLLKNAHGHVRSSFWARCSSTLTLYQNKNGLRSFFSLKTQSQTQRNKGNPHTPKSIAMSSARHFQLIRNEFATESLSRTSFPVPDNLVQTRQWHSAVTVLATVCWLPLLQTVKANRILGGCDWSRQPSSFLGKTAAGLLSGKVFIIGEIQGRSREGWRMRAREREQQRTLMCHHGWYVDRVNARHRHLEPQFGVNTRTKVSEKNHVWGVFVCTNRRLQLIVVDCKRNSATNLEGKLNIAKNRISVAEEGVQNLHKLDTPIGWMVLHNFEPRQLVTVDWVILHEKELK